MAVPPLHLLWGHHHAMNLYASIPFLVHPLNISQYKERGLLHDLHYSHQLVSVLHLLLSLSDHSPLAVACPVCCTIAVVVVSLSAVVAVTVVVLLGATVSVW
jgi:hypothetical protein